MSESGKSHPVLLYIHGESYDWGSGNLYDGSVLASYTDQVVVTINYRLGVLGFLNANISPHTKARVANYGLMDQLAALHWVKENIALFGGDPGNVTLMGHGTGAACVNFLAISPTVIPGKILFIITNNLFYPNSLMKYLNIFNKIIISRQICTYVN